MYGPDREPEGVHRRAVGREAGLGGVFADGFQKCVYIYIYIYVIYVIICNNVNVNIHIHINTSNNNNDNMDTWQKAFDLRDAWILPDASGKILSGKICQLGSGRSALLS